MAKFLAAVTYKDAYKRQTSRRFKVEALDFPTAQTAVDAFVAEVVDVTKLQVVKHVVSQETPVVDTFDAGANVDTGMTLTCLIGGIASKRGSMKIPGPVAAIITPDGKIDLTQIDMAALVTVLQNGTILISDGEVIDMVETGKLDK